jgi:hypothetical protein
MLQQSRPGIQRCLDRAGECERLAELPTDPGSREIYVRIASQWRWLAARHECIAPADSRAVNARE